MNAPVYGDFADWTQSFIKALSLLEGDLPAQKAAVEFFRATNPRTVEEKVLRAAQKREKE